MNISAARTAAQQVTASVAPSITDRTPVLASGYCAGRLRIFYPLASLLLSSATFLAGFGIRGAFAAAPLSVTGVEHELAAHLSFYFCLTVLVMGLFALIGWVVGQQADRLRFSAISDPGTNLWNRRHFEERLPAELCSAASLNAPLSLLVIDVDRLKQLNDRLGHEAGDTALRLVAEALRRNCRGQDLPARWGGDEFVVILPRTRAEQAAVFADRLRETLCRFAKTRMPCGLPLSVSIGISDLERVDEKEAIGLFGSADRALRVAKMEGRDRVVLARRHWTKKIFGLGAPRVEAPPATAAGGKRLGGGR